MCLNSWQLALGIAIDAHFYWCNMINDVIYMLLTFPAIISRTHTHTHSDAYRLERTRTHAHAP